MLRIFILLAFFCWTTLGVAGDVYKTVDENGNVTYTDKPIGPNSEKITVEEPISVPRVIPQPRTIKVSPPPGPQSYKVIMTYPTPELHLNPGTFDLPIQVSTEPNVHPDHKLVVLDNGEPIEGMLIEYIIRGSHVIQAQVVDAKGKVLGSSDPVNVYVHRPSINSRNNIEQREQKTP